MLRGKVSNLVFTSLQKFAHRVGLSHFMNHQYGMGRKYPIGLGVIHKRRPHQGRKGVSSNADKSGQGRGLQCKRTSTFAQHVAQ